MPSFKRKAAQVFQPAATKYLALACAPVLMILISTWASLVNQSPWSGRPWLGVKGEGGAVAKTVFSLPWKDMGG